MPLVPSSHVSRLDEGSNGSAPSRAPRRKGLAAPMAAAAAAAAVVAAALEDVPDEAALPLEYDSEALADYCRRRPCTVLRRCFEVSISLAPLIARVVFDWRSGALKNEEVCHGHAVMTREILTRLGPAFVKAGQALSIRPDLVPEAALKELQRLCDDCPPFPWPAAREVLEAGLCHDGQALGDLFSFGTSAEMDGADIEPKPVAAASLGQVYRWTRRHDGRQVAVKVQRPGMAHSVAVDMHILRYIARLTRFFLRQFTASRVDHVMLLDAWARGAYGELDYEAEAWNQEQFKRELEPRMGGRIYVPEVDHKLTSKRVLVSEWVAGPRLADCSPDVVRTLVPVGVECFLAQLLEIGAFHSDPHPGNLLVNDGRLVLIDFGLVAEIGRPSMESLAVACVHLISADYGALFDDLVALELLPPDADKEQILPPLTSVLRQGMRAGANIKRRAKNFQAISDDLNKVFYEMPFQVPDYFALITRALAVLEGIALVGDPEFDIFWAAYPYAFGKAVNILGSRRASGLLSAAMARSAMGLSAEERAAVWHSEAAATDAKGRAQGPDMLAPAPPEPCHTVSWWSQARNAVLAPWGWFAATPAAVVGS